MTLLELACEAGLKPYWAASTQGGEYKSGCPACGGSKRFFIQPNKQMKNCSGYYKCRECECCGDAIQFAITFLGMDFKQAVAHVNATLQNKPYISKPVKNSFRPAKIIPTPNLWQIKADSFIEWANNNIWKETKILEMLCNRGLPTKAIRTYKIGWCPQDLWRNKKNWGIPITDKSSNILWIPQGIVIPSLEKNGKVLRIKARRTAWKPIDKIGKYIAISGSMNGLSIIGNTKNKLMIVVESELDAYAIHYTVSDLAFVVAIGSNIKNPDNVTDYLAKHRSILLCYDNDDGGKTMYNKWKKLYQHVKPYPTPFGKDIGEAIQQGLDVRSWIIKHGWDKEEDLLIIDWFLQYVKERTVTRKSYVTFEKEIALGRNSPRAKTGVLQKGLKLMKQLVSMPTCS